MIAIDTNVLVRIIVEDTGQIEQTKIARELAKTAQKVYITQIVQVECAWVLAKVYKIGKTELLKVLEHLQVNPDYVLQHDESFQTALALFRQSQADFADCLILAESQCAKTTLYTFDKRLGKHSDTILL
ncbi:MAG: type II toxin-antitoxin system VapC family toxin [Methylococcales bacterium]|nr:type II toxin-antitoxin system VapC family toxin [Methylococcales bacterium]